MIRLFGILIFAVLAIAFRDCTGNNGRVVIVKSGLNEAQLDSLQSTVKDQFQVRVRSGSVVELICLDSIVSGLTIWSDQGFINPSPNLRVRRGQKVVINFHGASAWYVKVDGETIASQSLMPQIE